jgi:hypothetical protein
MLLKVVFAAVALTTTWPMIGFAETNPGAARNPVLGDPGPKPTPLRLASQRPGTNYQNDPRSTTGEAPARAGAGGHLRNGPSLQAPFRSEEIPQ